MNNKTNLLSKFKFLFKRSIVIVIIGDEKESAEVKIIKLLNIYFKNKKEFLIFTADNKNINNLKFFLKLSKKPIFVITEIKALQKNISDVIDSLTRKTNLVLSIDIPIIERIRKTTDAETLTFGFSQESDFTIINDDASLKIDYKGSIIPTWLKTKSKKETYSVLSSLVIGFILGLNLVEISQIFKKDNISL